MIPFIAGIAGNIAAFVMGITKTEIIYLPIVPISVFLLCIPWRLILTEPQAPTRQEAREFLLFLGVSLFRFSAYSLGNYLVARAIRLIF